MTGTIIVTSVLQWAILNIYCILRYLCYAFNCAKLCDHVYNIVVKPLKKTWLWWESGIRAGPATVRFCVRIQPRSFFFYMMG